MSLQQGDLLILNSHTDAQLATWWRLLNSWEWPAEIPDEEPKDWKGPSRRSSLMHEIEERIGFKACLREWNRERMSDEEFDQFWTTNRVPDAVTKRLSSSFRRIER